MICNIKYGLERNRKRWNRLSIGFDINLSVGFDMFQNKETYYCLRRIL